MKLSKVRLNRGGYDKWGKYYGTGKPVYEAQAEVCGKDRMVHVRASSRNEAKTEAQASMERFKKWPHCSDEARARHGYAGLRRRKKRKTRRSRR